MEDAAREAAMAAIDLQAVNGDPLKALIINLESSRDRLENISAHLERAGVEFERVPGIRGSELSSYAVRRLAPNWARAINADDRMGTLGCFLGHIRAWEKVAGGDGRCYLVLEDDAAPYVPLPRSLSALNIAQDFDLCFCNARMERLFHKDEPFPTRPKLFTSLEARNSRPPTQKGTGGEAYFLTKAGAAKLLEVIDLTGPFTHVDWFLFMLGISEEEAKALRQDDRALKVYTRFRDQFRPARHIAFRMTALWPALMSQRGFASTRRAENAA